MGDEAGGPTTGNVSKLPSVYLEASNLYGYPCGSAGMGSVTEALWGLPVLWIRYKGLLVRASLVYELNTVLASLLV